MLFTETELRIGGRQVMQAWERPLMEVLARAVTATAGDVLEIGYGMGISAQAIMDRGCCSYTVIEAHPEIAARARVWGRQQPCAVTVLDGFWQRILPDLDARFDGILSDTFPVTQQEEHLNPAAIAPEARRHLRPGGVLAYYSGASDNFPLDQLRPLLASFEEVKLLKVMGLQPYAWCDYWNESYMVVPVAKRAR